MTQNQQSEHSEFQRLHRLIAGGVDVRKNRKKLVQLRTQILKAENNAENQRIIRATNHYID